jgi:hypothetical protein
MALDLFQTLYYFHLNSSVYQKSLTSIQVKLSFIICLFGDANLLQMSEEILEIIEIRLLVM